jgi:hypothetical protein
LSCSLLCWAWGLATHLGLAGGGCSTTQVSLGLFWLAHLGVALGGVCLLLGGAGWRLGLRTPAVGGLG